MEELCLLPFVRSTEAVEKIQRPRKAEIFDNWEMICPISLDLCCDPS